MVAHMLKSGMLKKVKKKDGTTDYEYVGKTHTQKIEIPRRILKEEEGKQMDLTETESFASHGAHFMSHSHGYSPPPASYMSHSHGSHGLHGGRDPTRRRSYNNCHDGPDDPKPLDVTHIQEAMHQAEPQLSVKCPAVHSSLYNNADDGAGLNAWVIQQAGGCASGLASETNHVTHQDDHLSSAAWSGLIKEGSNSCCSCLRMSAGYSRHTMRAKAIDESFVWKGPGEKPDYFDKANKCVDRKCECYKQMSMMGQSCAPGPGYWNVHPINRCVHCECVAECTDFVYNCHGRHSTQMQQLRTGKNSCEKEDDKFLKCAFKHLKTVFCVGPACGIAGGSSAGAAAANFMMGMLMFIVDNLLGCALSFIAQPSFWRGSTENDVQTAAQSSAEAIYNPVGDIVQAQSASLRKLNEEAAKNEGVAVFRHFGTTLRDESKQVMESKMSGITARVGQGVSKAGKAASKRIGKAVKNFLPCVAFALLAIFDAGTSFMACMFKCCIETMGSKIVELALRIIGDCLVRVIIDAICFPADATVQTADGKVVRMDELQVGDRVLSSSGKPSEVYLFSHQRSNVMAEFTRLDMIDGNSLELTQRHFLPISKACDGTVENMYAGNVGTGMCVQVMGTNSTSHSPQLTMITKTSVVTKRGVYNPFTVVGDLVVNNVVASSHSDWFLDSVAEATGFVWVLPSVYQTILAPARWMYWAVGADVARHELGQYQTTLDAATEKNQVFKPYFDLASRVVQIIAGNAISFVSTLVL